MAARRLKEISPGLAVCLALAAAAIGAQALEQALTGRSVLEALAIAILLGVALGAFWRPGAAWTPGVRFGGHRVLELAVALLGASISFQEVVATGPRLIAGIALTVLLSLAASYGVSRALKLPRRLSLLIACGNSICGSSAIAAVAPVIAADAQDVAASIAFTAVVGVAMVLGLPLLDAALKLSTYQYGVFAGLTVYAVPQVLAATLPVAVLSAQMGTIVKLVRVMMLGPIVLAISFARGRSERGLDSNSPTATQTTSIPLLPWFITGFLALAAARSFGLIPDAAETPIVALASFLTVVSMAALGLAVDFQELAKAGARATFAVVVSILILGTISFALIRLLGLR